MGSHHAILIEPWREANERWLAGRLGSPLREPGARLNAATRLEQWLRARGVSEDPRLPSALIARLRAGRPTLVHHALALDEVTNAGIYACLRMLGHDLEDLPLLQGVLHRDRTVILPTATYDRERRIEWPTRFNDNVNLARGEFLPELVARLDSHVVAAVDAGIASRFVYLRVGHFDTDLVPSVVPGSIVQVDTADRGPTRFISRAHRRDHRPIYAVAHVRGLTCAYVDWLDERRIALIPNHHRKSPTIHRVDDEAVVLGRVCAELRPMDVDGPTISPLGHDRCASRVLLPDPERQTFGAFLRAAREVIGMTHRHAHAISVRVANAYNDRRFAIGVGTLSDWESQRDLPLSVAHVISLAACYSVSFTDLLRASRLLPADRLPSLSRLASQPLDVIDVPLFQPALLPAVRLAADLPDLSWEDVFRCGDGATPFDRTLVGARYAIVNRRIRGVTRSSSSSSIDRPLYVLSDECGRQICAGCFSDRDHLYIQPDPYLPPPIRAVPRGGLKVRGRVAAILRCR